MSASVISRSIRCTPACYSKPSCERYEKRQVVILTSNKAFADWGQVCAGDTVIASAALDRLLRRSTVINIRGDSYRVKEKRIAKASAVDMEAMPVT
jgi:hypothetical protein